MARKTLPEQKGYPKVKKFGATYSVMSKPGNSVIEWIKKSGFKSRKEAINFVGGGGGNKGGGGGQ